MSVLIPSILIVSNLNLILANYLDVDGSYRTPRLERKNVVNKGTWVRNYKDTDKITGNFLFRGNSIDADNIVHADFNAFNDNNAGSAFITSYVERSKRSADVILRPKLKKLPKKYMSLENENKEQHLSVLNAISKAADKRVRRYRSLNNCKTKNCDPIVEENESLVESKLLSKLKPTSVFNDYPYEIAILLGNNKEAMEEAKNYSSYILSELNKDNQTVTHLAENNATDTISVDNVIKNENLTVTDTPKRSKNNIESEIIKKIELNEELNKTQENARSFDKDVFAKEDKAWYQNAPVPDINRYKVLGKDEQQPKPVRPVTEKGLIKVLSMLTNTFKKIMKQHNEIKEIQKKLHNMNDDFVKNVEIVSERFQDFETKYAGLVNINQKFMEIEEKINAREQHFKARERELSKNLVEFEIQQKKFLTQQRQFYNIQKLMLAQNERINSKQNAIAKTQSEISHRQNNFARILKKAKQVYFDNKHFPNQPKQTTISEKIEKSSETKDDYVTHTTTMTPEATESVKINLFSIPTVTQLKNQDHLLLNDKDEQPVDELVYKYYFNNTFIDSLMKNFLSGFISNDNNDNLRSVKNKRDEAKKKATIHRPINKTDDKNEDTTGKALKRERRWISHHSKKKYRHKSKGKDILEALNDDEKVLKPKKHREENFIEPDALKALFDDLTTTLRPDIDVQKTDAFINMAAGFCNGIGQNATPQQLDWCIEKALRKLKSIDINMPPLPLPPSPFPQPDVVETNIIELQPIKQELRTRKTTTTAIPISESTTLTTTTPTSYSTLPSERMKNTVGVPAISTLLPTTKDFKSFFPDNDKLESNLKQFDLKTDTEGNVYYDGSLHASDVIKDNNSDSDILPSLDSNSRIDTMDPENFDSHAMRRALLRRNLLSRIKYESMLKKMTKL